MALTALSSHSASCVAGTILSWMVYSVSLSLCTVMWDPACCHVFVNLNFLPLGQSPLELATCGVLVGAYLFNTNDIGLIGRVNIRSIIDFKEHVFSQWRSRCAVGSLITIRELRSADD